MLKSKKALSLLMTIVLVVTSCISSILPVNAATTVNVDPADRRQTMEGWGTSLCWWGNEVGNWSSSLKDDIIDLLFDQASGLGLNIARYNIGGGENPSHEHMRVSAEIPGYEPSPGVWDWSADAGQRWVLQQAVGKGVNITEAFSNSPPYWMTDSQCSAGSANGGNNLKSDMYDEFADYLTEVVKHFRDNWGITFRTLSVMNEPISTWWKSSNNQEGCHFDRADQNQILKLTGASLASKGLSGTALSAGEEYSIDDSITSYNSFDSTVKSYITQVNTHTYGGSNRAGLRVAANSDGKKVWNSEVSIGGSANHSHNDMTSALEQSRKILTDLNDMGADAWVYWQAVENEAGNNNHGLIHANFTGTEDYWVTKQYYSMGNYSKFIKQGYTVIGSDNPNTLAAVDLAAGKLVLVVTNDTSSNADYTYNLSGFDAIGASAAAYRTSATENLAQLSNIPVTGKALSITAAANSITTYVIPDAAYSNNLVKVNDSVVGTGSNQFSYSGAWERGAQSGAFWNDNHWSGATDSYYQVKFTGVQAKVYMSKANSHGIAGVSVDGGTETLVDLYSSARQDQVLAYISPVLPSGQHTIKIRVTGNKNSSSSGYAVIADRVDVSKTAQSSANLLSDPDFESGGLGAWTGEWNPGLAGVETNYPHGGTYDAYLHPSSSADVAIYQTVTAPASKTYTLTAYCATNISGSVRLGVDVAGSQAGQASITATSGYAPYTVSFSAAAGQEIKIWYYSGKANGWATIDDVVLQ